MRNSHDQRVTTARPDAVFQELLADPRNEVRPPPDHIPLAVLRQAADARLALAPRRDIRSSADLGLDLDSGDVPARLYRPHPDRNLPIILFLHGGGWVWGSLDSHDSMCRSLALDSGCAVLSLGYRLSPEAPFPAALDDVAGALRWITEYGADHGLDAGRMALCGDSSGGNLALIAALETTVTLSALGLFYPPLDPECGSPSQDTFGRGHLLTRDGMRWFWAQYLQDTATPAPARAAPLSRDLSGLPPVSIGLAECDILHDEGCALAQALEGAGVPARLRVYRGQIHAFVSLPHVTPAAEIAIRDMAHDLRDHLNANPESQQP